jgi:hypothetical protein
MPFCVPADVTTVSHTVYKLVNRSGEEFMDVEDLKWTIDAGNCHIHFNNLFGGDKILGKTVVRRVQVVHRLLCCTSLYAFLLLFLLLLSSSVSAPSSIFRTTFLFPQGLPLKHQ